MWNVILEEKEKSFINIVGSRQNSREGVDESAANSEEKKRNCFPLEIPESWLSKRSPGSDFKSRFCEKVQTGYSLNWNFELPKLGVEAITDKQIQTAFQ